MATMTGKRAMTNQVDCERTPEQASAAPDRAANVGPIASRRRDGEPGGDALRTTALGRSLRQ